jgi:hypothetical protein
MVVLLSLFSVLYPVPYRLTVFAGFALGGEVNLDASGCFGRRLKLNRIQALTRMLAKVGGIITGFPIENIEVAAAIVMFGGVN